MSGVGHFKRMLAYEADAMAKAAASIDSIPVDRQGEAAATKARGILAHVQSARHVWLSRLGFIAPRSWEMFPDWTTAQTLTDAARLDADWSRYLATLQETELDRRIEYRTLDGTAVSSTVAEILTHVFNHSTYHRGQVTLLVSQCGGQRAVTDFIAFSRVKAGVG
ncbi:MAG: DinB family protein [Phycisphaerales bacterium]